MNSLEENEENIQSNRCVINNSILLCTCDDHNIESLICVHIFACFHKIAEENQMVKNNLLSLFKFIDIIQSSFINDHNFNNLIIGEMICKDNEYPFLLSNL